MASHKLLVLYCGLDWSPGRSFSMLSRRTKAKDQGFDSLKPYSNPFSMFNSRPVASTFLLYANRLAGSRRTRKASNRYKNLFPRFYCYIILWIRFIKRHYITCKYNFMIYNIKILFISALKCNSKVELSFHFWYSENRKKHSTKL